jgi:anti-sigma factor RsiW
MTSACDAVRSLLPGVMDGDLPADVTAHTGTCLRCQAEIAQYRRMGRALRSLEPQMAVAPLGLHQSVMRAVAEAQGRAHVWKGALIGAGGFLVAAAGTTAGILLSRARHRAAS